MLPGCRARSWAPGGALSPQSQPAIAASRITNQRRIHHLLNRGETRNSLARDVFHGHRGQPRKHYQVGQENQLDTLRT